MLAVADSAQPGLFDASWCGKVVRRDSFYGLLAEQGERIVCDGDFADCYAEGCGRPSIPPSTLAKILLLAYRCGLSDRQAMEAVRFDLRWKVALCLPLDHEGFHPTSLVKFRARLLLHGKERVVFERSLELASELGLISGQVEQILDSTPMLALRRCRTRRRSFAVRCGGSSMRSRLRTRRLPGSSGAGFALTIPGRG
jgi:transposase